jgi:hypothetical protein
MKKALYDAVNEGADFLAWTTGEQQAERYSLEKQVSSISHNRGLGEYTDRYGLIVTGKNGETILSKSFEESELEGVVGKELAAKIIADEGREGDVELSNGDVIRMKTLSGLDLKVGGEGLKKLYDRTLVSIANDLGKKGGSKAAKIGIKTAKNRKFEAVPATEGTGAPVIGFRGEQVFVLRDIESGEYVADDYGNFAYLPSDGKHFSEAEANAIANATEEAGTTVNAIEIP